MQGHMSFKFVWNEMQKTEMKSLKQQFINITYRDKKITPFITLLNLVFLMCCIFLNYWSKAGTCPSSVLIISSFSTENHCWTHGFLYPCSILELRFSDIFVKLNMHVAHQRLSTCLSIASSCNRTQEPLGIWSSL